jgi:hypothetical protein
MIRIDEIYQNVFVPQSIASPDDVGCHWFHPFGTTDFENICNIPPINFGNRYIFWDQEPLHLERVVPFMDQFVDTYKGDITVVHSEYSSSDAQWLKDTYSVNDAYYFFHGWAALDWYRGYNRSFLHKPTEIKHTFLCVNNIVGGKRQHRLELFNLLLEKNLVDTNLISMPARCPYEGIAVQDFLGKRANLPLQVDSFDNHANNSHQITLWQQAANTLVHVVTETAYTGNKNHLTEKTFKPIVLKQPFVVVANQGSLAYLRKYGFKTFDSIWDESYDLLPDDKRCSAVADLLESLEHSDWDDIHNLCKPIVQHNYDWFYSGKFEQMLWDELLGVLEHW